MEVRPYGSTMMGLPQFDGHLGGGADGLDRNNQPERKQRLMGNIIHFIDLEIHKESVAVSIAPGDSTEVHHYGTIGGRLEVLDRVIKKLVASSERNLATWPVQKYGCGLFVAPLLRAAGRRSAPVPTTRLK